MSSKTHQCVFLIFGMFLFGFAVTFGAMSAPDILRLRQIRQRHTQSGSTWTISHCNLSASFSWTSPDPCQWCGIDQCNTSGYPILFRINISNGFQGSFVDFFSDVLWTYLTGINISVSGEISLTGPVFPEKFSGFPLYLSNVRDLHIATSGNIGLLSDVQSLPVLSFLSVKGQGTLGMISRRVTSLKDLMLTNVKISFDALQWFPNLEKLTLNSAFESKISIQSLPLAGFPKLEYLSISNADIVGPLPDDLFTHPTLNQFNLASLPNLDFESRIIGNLLAKDQFTAIKIFNCKKIVGNIILPNADNSLLSFSLHDTGVSGPLPTFSRFGRLTFLLLTFQGHSGVIPEELANHPKLEYLILRGNSLSGQLPQRISPSIITLDFSYNMLTGRIPNSYFSSNSSVGGLLLNTNKLFGSLPNFRSDISYRTLYHLNLSDNLFSGTIPTKFIGNIDGNGNIKINSSFVYLNLSSNFFMGSLDPLIFNANPGLEYFNISFNKFVGNLIVNSCSKLTRLEVSENFLSGSLPEGLLKRCPKLISASFDFNYFSGSIPQDYSLPSKLKVLSVAGNFISGTFPQLNNGTNMELILAPFNSFSCRLPKFNASTSKVLKTNQSYVLIGNDITGPLPDWVLETDPFLYNMDVTFWAETQGTVIIALSWVVIIFLSLFFFHNAHTKIMCLTMWHHGWQNGVRKLLIPNTEEARLLRRIQTNILIGSIIFCIVICAVLMPIYFSTNPANDCVSVFTRLTMAGIEMGNKKTEIVEVVVFVISVISCFLFVRWMFFKFMPEHFKLSSTVRKLEMLSSIKSAGEQCDKGDNTNSESSINIDVFRGVDRWRRVKRESRWSKAARRCFSVLLCLIGLFFSTLSTNVVVVSNSMPHDNNLRIPTDSFWFTTGFCGILAPLLVSVCNSVFIPFIANTSTNIELHKTEYDANRSTSIKSIVMSIAATLVIPIFSFIIFTDDCYSEFTIFWNLCTRGHVFIYGTEALPFIEDYAGIYPNILEDELRYFIKGKPVVTAASLCRASLYQQGLCVTKLVSVLGPYFSRYLISSSVIVCASALCFFSRPTTRLIQCFRKSYSPCFNYGSVYSAYFTGLSVFFVFSLVYPPIIWAGIMFCVSRLVTDSLLISFIITPDCRDTCEGVDDATSSPIHKLPVAEFQCNTIIQPPPIVMLFVAIIIYCVFHMFIFWYFAAYTCFYITIVMTSLVVFFLLCMAVMHQLESRRNKIRKTNQARWQTKMMMVTLSRGSVSSSCSLGKEIDNFDGESKSDNEEDINAVGVNLNPLHENVTSSSDTMGYSTGKIGRLDEKELKNVCDERNDSNGNIIISTPRERSLSFPYGDACYGPSSDDQLHMNNSSDVLRIPKIDFY